MKSCADHKMTKVTNAVSRDSYWFMNLIKKLFKILSKAMGLR